MNRTMDEEAGLTVEEALMCGKLRSMRMSNMADALEAQFLDPNADLRPFSERIAELVDLEWQARYDKKFARYMKKATLRYPAADLDQSIYDPERMLDTAVIERLATCEWVDGRRNLLITGPTSSGKSYLANALCISALRKFKTVRYIKASTLMSELDRARTSSLYLDCVQAFAKLDLLAIDDFGLMELDLDRCRDLFEVIDARDGRGSTMVVSQLPVSKWLELFADATYADACLSRVSDRRSSYRLEMNGKSMRQTA